MRSRNCLCPPGGESVKAVGLPVHLNQTWVDDKFLIHALSWIHTYGVNKNLAASTNGGSIGGVSFTIVQDHENRIASWIHTHNEDIRR